MHVWTAEIGFSRLFETNKKTENEVAVQGQGVDPGGVRGRSGDGYGANIL